MDDFKSNLDTASLVAASLGFIEFIPTIVAVTSGILAIIWYVIRLYEYFKNKRNVDK